MKIKIRAFFSYEGDFMKTEKQEIFETYCEYIFVKGWSKEKAFKKISRFYNVFISTLEKWYEEENWEQKITDEDWQARAIAKNEERLKRKEKIRMRRKKEQQAIEEEKVKKEEDMKKRLNRGKRFKRYRCPNCSLPIEECTCGYFDDLTRHINDKPEMNNDAESNLSSKVPKNGKKSSSSADVSVSVKNSSSDAVSVGGKKSRSKPKVSKSIKKSKKEKDILKKTSKTSIQLSANQEKILSEISDSIKKGYKFIVLEANEGNSDIAVKLANNFDSSLILTSNEKSQMRYNKKYELGKNSKIHLSNHKSFFDEGNNIEEGDLLVIDGAHRLDENIADLFSYPIYLDDYRDLINNFKCRFKDLPEEEYTTWLDFFKHLHLDNDKVKRVAACIKQNPKNWICSYVSKNEILSFYPLNIADLAKKYWFSKGKVCVLISSRILDSKMFAKGLGLDISHTKFIQSDETVYSGSNKIYARKTASINNRKLLIQRIEKILENHKNEKGLILTGKRNYKGIFRRFNDQRIIILGDYDYNKKIKKFIEVSDSVIVTDSLEDEFEFPYEQCKFQIIMNAHVHKFDKRFEIKENEYGLYSYKKNIDLGDSLKRQATSESDCCITYVLDDNILTAVSYDITHNRILPKYVIDSMVDLDMNDCGFVSKNIKKQFGVYYKFDYYKDRKSENKDIWAYKDYNKESPDIYLKEFDYFTTELMKAISELSNDIIDSSINKLALVAVPSSTIERNKSSTMKESINVIESWQDDGKTRSDFYCKKEIINCGDLLKRVTDVTTAHLSKNLSKPRPSYVEHINSMECEKNDVLKMDDIAFIILDDISTRGTIMNACEDILIKNGVKKENIYKFAIYKTQKE